MSRPTEDDSAELHRHNAGQRAYYDRRRPVRMDPVDSPYVHLHFSRAIAAIGLQPGETVLEVGAGMGRFTRQFARLGHPMTAVELSPSLARDCRAAVSAWPGVEVVTADLLDAPALLAGPFDVVAGFFMLHHLTCLERYFAVINSMLRPGGRCVFVEPNPWNPLFAVQVTFTPGMSWKEEAGIYDLGAGNLRRAATEGGLTNFAVRRHGFFPRWLHNQCEAAGINPWLEKLTPAGLRPFQVISASRAAPHE